MNKKITIFGYDWRGWPLVFFSVATPYEAQARKTKTRNKPQILRLNVHLVNLWL